MLKKLFKAFQKINFKSFDQQMKEQGFHKLADQLLGYTYCLSFSGKYRHKNNYDEIDWKTNEFCLKEPLKRAGFPEYLLDWNAKNIEAILITFEKPKIKSGIEEDPPEMKIPYKLYVKRRGN